MRHAREQVEVGTGKGTPVLACGGFHHPWRDDVVLAAGEQQQRGPIAVAEVDGRGGPRGEIRQRALEEHAAGAGYGVPVVDGTSLLRAERVGERIAELR